MHTLPQQLANGLFIGSMYGLIAVGYTMVYGIVQLINFAHGEIYMTGAFGALTVWTNLPHGTSIWLALPLMLLGGGIVSVLIAIGAERFAYRPLRTAPRLAPLITAIGLSLALQQAIFIWYPGADNAKPFPQLGTHAYHVGSIDIQRGDIFLVASAAICMTFLAVFVRTSRTGRAMQATAQDPDTAQLMGIDTNRIIVIAFAIGGFFAAVAGLPPASNTARSATTWASRPASRRSPRPSSAASATSTARCSAASSSASPNPAPPPTSPTSPACSNSAAEAGPTSGPSSSSFSSSSFGPRACSASAPRTGRDHTMTDLPTAAAAEIAATPAPGTRRIEPFIPLPAAPPA